MTVAVFINGINAAALKEDEVATGVVLNAVKHGILAGASSAFGVPFSPRHTAMRLQGARRLQADLRALQGSAGVGVEMDMTPPGDMKPTDLFESLRTNAAKIGAAVVKSVKEVPNLEELVPLVGPISANVAVTKYEEEAPEAAAVAALLDVVNNVKGETFEKLANDGGEVTVPLPGVGILVAAKLDSMGSSFNSGPVEIELPKTFLSKFSVAAVDDELVFSAIAVDSDKAESLGGLAAVALDLNSITTGKKVTVAGLVEPVEIKLPVIFNGSSLSCAYWDEETARWSTRGVSMSSRSVPGGELYCETTHFSLFGAIASGMIATVLCANFDMFTSENMREVLKGDWHQSYGALIFFALAGGLLFLFVCAAFLDYLRWKKYCWNDEFFLVPSVASFKPEPDVDEDAPPAEERLPWTPKPKTAAVGCFAVTLGCSESDAWKDAIDDICSSWFEYFGELREILESICSGCEGLWTDRSFTLMGLAFLLSDRMVKKLLLASSRRSTAVSLGLSIDLITFVLDSQELACFIMDGEVERRLASQGHSAGTQEFLGLRPGGSLSFASKEVRRTSPSFKRSRAPDFSFDRSPRCPTKQMVSEEAGNAAVEEEGGGARLEAISSMPLPMPSSGTSFPFEEESEGGGALSDFSPSPGNSEVLSRASRSLDFSSRRFKETASTRTPRSLTSRSAERHEGFGEDSEGCSLATTSMRADEVLSKILRATSPSRSSRAHSPSTSRATSFLSGTSLRTNATGHWRLSTDQLQAWSLLREEVCEALLHQTGHKQARNHSVLDLCRTFLYLNPIGELYCIDIFRTSAQKAALFAADVLGQFVMVAIFFQGAGMVARRRNVGNDTCGGGAESLGMRIGRFLVIATASLLLAACPVTILESLTNKGFKKIDGAQGSEAWQKQLRSWKLQERLFWCVALLFNGFCAAYLLVFVANIAPESYGDFSLAGSLGVVEDVVAFPLAISVCIPVLARLWLFVHSRASKVPEEEVVRKAREFLHNETNMMLPINAV